MKNMRLIPLITLLSAAGLAALAFAPVASFAQKDAVPEVPASPADPFQASAENRAGNKPHAAPEAGEKSHLDYVVATGLSHAARQNLVIPKDGPDTKYLAEIEDDLVVMAHILEKAASSRDDASRAMGIAIYSGFGAAPAPQNLYIEGYGAVFLLNVTYPLLPPPAAKEAAETKDDTSSEWEEARREVSQPANPAFRYRLEQTITRLDAGGEKYDADKVDDLKNNLLTALKNASHIRRLKSDESVTVVVTSSSASPAGQAFRADKATQGGGGGYGSGFGRSGGGNNFGAWMATGSDHPDSRGTRLILRAKKSDLDAFQKDKLNLDDLRKKASLIIY
jgi:hypothetical protein